MSRRSGTAPVRYMPGLRYTSYSRGQGSWGVWDSATGKPVGSAFSGRGAMQRAMRKAAKLSGRRS